MTVTIERGVPIPAAHSGKRGELQAVLKQMRNGDSAFFPGKTSQSLWAAGRIAFGSGNFTVRKVEGGARIWRI